MNKKRIREVAIALLSGKLAKRKRNFVEYNQTTFGSKTCRDNMSCGMIACIAGHVVALFDPQFYRQYFKHVNRNGMSARAQKLLGISDVQAAELFHGSPLSGFRSPTKEEAALVLFQLAETGRVNWNWVKITE